MQEIYIINPNTPVLWGDYGGILAHGMAERNSDGQLELERTGPFIPPISFPGFTIVVTDGFKQKLEHSRLKGLSFRPAVKKRIVHLDWEKWDWKAADPVEYPDSGEPEDYILETPHSSEVAEKLGVLWELAIEQQAEIVRVKTGPRILDEEIWLRLDGWDGRDWFKARGVLHVYVSKEAKSWLEAEPEILQWVRFSQALVK